MAKPEEVIVVSAAGAAAAAAAIAQAIRASGVLVRVSPNDFQKVLRKGEQSLVIYATGGLFKSNHQYLTSYRGFAFFTKSDTEIILPAGAETILAKKIWIP
jgi:glycogen synthase